MQLSKIQSIYWTNLSHRIHSLAKLCSLWLFGCLGYLSLKLFIKVRRWLIFGRLYPLLLFCLWTGGEGLPRSSHNMEDTAGSLAVTHFIGVHNSPHTHTRTYASLLAHARTHRYTCTHTHTGTTMVPNATYVGVHTYISQTVGHLLVGLSDGLLLSMGPLLLLGVLLSGLLLGLHSLLDACCMCCTIQDPCCTTWSRCCTMIWCITQWWCWYCPNSENCARIYITI